MTIKDLLKFLEDEDDKIKRDMARTLLEVHRTCRPEFAERVEKYLLEHDLLPRGRKAN